MHVGTSILLIAVGAILRFATTIQWHANTINWKLVGDILMVVGVIGLIVSLIWLGTSRRDNTTMVVDRNPVD